MFLFYSLSESNLSTVSGQLEELCMRNSRNGELNISYYCMTTFFTSTITFLKYFKTVIFLSLSKEFTTI